MEKHRATQSQIHSIVINQDKITDQAEIIKQLFSFNWSLLLRKVQIQANKVEPYLKNAILPKLTNEQTLIFEGIKFMENNFEMIDSLKNYTNVSEMKS